MNKNIANFQYLTQDLDSISHQELVEIACKNGIKWIQLRVKNKSFDEWLQIAKEAKVITSFFGATLIINDNIDIVKIINADGVHLGKKDIAILEARKILGNTKIIGATANTLEDIVEHQKNGANYVGLGPFKFTKTKQNLSTILGINGYENICRNNHFNIPIIAIGGILIEDVIRILETNINGIAISSAINLESNKEAIIAQFLELMRKN